MLDFTNNDKQEINEAYKRILFNLKTYLQQYNVESELEYSKIIFNMLHSGFLSINRKIQFDNNYNYLGLPSAISEGVQVMYGICCCRHATELLYDLLCILNFNPSLIYFLTDNNTGTWHKVKPTKANHVAILSKGEKEYIIDPINKFILQIQKDGQLTPLDTNSGRLKPYQDDNIGVVARVLKKYYTYREEGVESVY